VNVNATLILELVFFGVFVWFCAAFVWPPILKAMQEREAKIADGLNAASRAEKDLELAQGEAKKQVKKAKEQAAAILDQANKRANQIVDDAKDEANAEAERILTAANAEVEQEMIRAKEELRAKVAVLALQGASKVLEAEVDGKAHSAVVEKLAEEL
jgi:F-type H+-transporting ATPase subunit b